MALLKYDISIVGTKSIDAALSGIERRFVQHNARIREVARSAGAGRASSSGGAASNAAVEREARRTNEMLQGLHAQGLAQQERAEKRASDAKLRRFAREERVGRAAAKAKVAAEKEASQRFREATIGKLGGSASTAIRGLGSLGASALSMSGISLSGAVSTQMSESSRAARLANMGGAPGAKRALLDESRRVSGFSGGEALGAMEAFVGQTQDLGAARALVGDLGQVALATGADFTELAASAGSAFNLIGETITDPTSRIVALRGVLSSLGSDANLGALASQIGGLGHKALNVEGGAAELLRSGGVMARAAVKQGGMAPKDATEAIAAFSREIAEDPSRFAAPRTGARGAKSRKVQTEDIILEVLSKGGGNLESIDKQFKGNAAKAVSGFAPIFASAAENAKRSGADEQAQDAAGRAAVSAEFTRLRNTAPTPDQVSARASSALAEPEAQLQEAVKAFNTAVGAELLPALTALIPTFRELLPAVGSAARVFTAAVKAFADNPVAGLGAVVLGKIAADLAAAKIGEGVKGLLMRVLGGGSGGAPGGGAPGGIGPGRLLGAASVGLVAGVALGETIESEGKGRIDAGEASMNESGQMLNRIRAMKGGSTSREDIDFARDAIDKQQDKVTALGKTNFFDDFMGVFGASNKEVETKTQETMLVEMRAAFAEVVKASAQQATAAGAIQAAADKMSSAGPNRTDGPIAPRKQ